MDKQAAKRAALIVRLAEALLHWPRVSEDAAKISLSPHRRRAVL